MQQPKMIVLALIGKGLRYGFEMEDFARPHQHAPVGEDWYAYNYKAR